MKSLVFLLAVFVLVQSKSDIKLVHHVGNEVIKGTDTSLKTSRAGLLIKLSEEVLKVKLSATKALGDELDTIKYYKEATQAQVEVAEDSVKSQLSTLESLVKNATAAAKADRKSIKSCIRDEKRSKARKVSLRYLSSCANSISFSALKLSLGKFGAIATEACTIIPTCSLLHPLSNQNLEQCVEAGLKRSRDKINQVMLDIDDEAEHIYEKGSACVGDRLGNLDLVIEDISDKFMECVRNRLNGTPSN